MLQIFTDFGNFDPDFGDFLDSFFPPLLVDFKVSVSFALRREDPKVPPPEEDEGPGLLTSNLTCSNYNTI